MGYFTYIADQAFHASPTGDLLFYRNGVWSKPYVITDLETARRLYKKHLWTLRLLVAGVLAGNFFLAPHIRDFVDRPYAALPYLTVFVGVYLLVDKIVWFRDFANLKRLGTPLNQTELNIQTAQRHNKLQVILFCLLSLTTFSLGVWMIAEGQITFGLLSILCSLLCGFSWFHILWLKLRMRL